MEKSPNRGQGSKDRDIDSIHIAILTQTESQATGLSTIQVTIDGAASELENITIESTASMFVKQSADTYKSTHVNVTMFINILIGIKANGWTMMGTNAFLNNVKQEVIKTFYFEKVIAMEPRRRSISNSSAAATAGGVNSVPPKKVGTYVTSTPGVGSSIVNEGLSPMMPMTRDRQPSAEGKATESVEQRIAAITAAQSVRKSFLLQQQQSTKASPMTSSRKEGNNNSNEFDDFEGITINTRRESIGDRNDRGDRDITHNNNNSSSSSSSSDTSRVFSPVGGSILNITPRAKSTTPGTRTTGIVGTGGVGNAGVSTDIQKKNAEYFKRMKQEQDLEKKKIEEEESKLDEAEQRRRREQKALQEAHESSKTAHFSRLGATFVTGGECCWLLVSYCF